MSIRKRIVKLEQQLNLIGKVWKLWDTHSDNEEKLIADIRSRKVINRDGSYFSENDFNYFLDFDKFAPDILRKSGQKYAETKN